MYHQLVKTFILVYSGGFGIHGPREAIDEAIKLLIENFGSKLPIRVEVLTLLQALCHVFCAKG